MILEVTAQATLLRGSIVLLLLWQRKASLDRSNYKLKLALGRDQFRRITLHRWVSLGSYHLYLGGCRIEYKALVRGVILRMGQHYRQ